MPDEAGRKCSAQVVLDEPDGESRILELQADIPENCRVDVDHGELADRVREVGVHGQQVNRDCDEIVVAQQDDPLPFERAGLVRRARVELRLGGAVRLVELRSGRRSVHRDSIELGGNRLELVWNPPAALVAGGGPPTSKRP